MIVIGLDVHKRSVTAVAVDEAGRPIEEKLIAVGSDALHEQDAELAQQLAPEADTAPDSADLETVANQLERTITEAAQGRRKPCSDC